MFVHKVHLLTGAVLAFGVVAALLWSAPVRAAQSFPLPSLHSESVPLSVPSATQPVLQPMPPVALPVPSAMQPVSPMALDIDRDCLSTAYGHNAAALALFDDAVVRESMAQPYFLEPYRPTPKAGEHPGRIRSYALLGAVYGQTKAEVQAQLHTVRFMGQSLRLAAAAAAAFTRVAQSLTTLAQAQPQLKSYMLPAGAFVWRTIAGDTRLSPHSFGIAVDLNPTKGPYWLWAAPSRRASQSAAARASYPEGIVAAFEAEGFIWGGKWHEYDMMHFEYRPELICKARAQHTSAALPE